MMGLVVLLNSHKGSEDVALLADDLDLEIDEILPALEFAEILRLVTVTEGRVTFTDLGKRFVAGSIRDRKAIVRDELRRTTLFRTLLRQLENAPDRTITDEQLSQVVAFTTAPADEAVQNIVNWGRYAELFRYDAAEHRLVASGHATSARAPPSRPPPSGGTATTAADPGGNRTGRGKATNPPEESKAAAALVPV
jgi:NitT/TauT family transport system ATP-binding protein